VGQHSAALLHACPNATQGVPRGGVVGSGVVGGGSWTVVYWQVPTLQLPKQHSAALLHRCPLGMQHRPTFWSSLRKVSQHLRHNLPVGGFFPFFGL
jgi:hypothetical protein